MYYVSTLLLYNTLQAATPLVDTIVYEALWEFRITAKSYYDVIVNNKIHQ